LPSSAGGRLSGPVEDDWAAAAVDDVPLPPRDGLLTLRWTGDVLRAVLGGRVVADQLYAGRPWQVRTDDLRRRAGLGPTTPATLRLEVLPFPATGAIWLDPEVRAAVDPAERVGVASAEIGPRRQR
jgi:beta-galactosidase